MKAEEILEELDRLGVERVKDRARLQKTEDQLASWFAKAKAHPDVDMSAAVKRAGVGRSMAYKLVRERS